MKSNPNAICAKAAIILSVSLAATSAMAGACPAHLPKAPILDISPAALAATRGGAMLSALPRDPGEFRKPLPGERYETYVQLQASHLQSRQQIVNARNRAMDLSWQEVQDNQANAHRRYRDDIVKRAILGRISAADVRALLACDAIDAATAREALAILPRD